MSKKIILKPFVNKKNKQMSVVIPKKKLKKLNPSIKFDKNLFVSLEVFEKK